jgi:hypothetical protein
MINPVAKTPKTARWCNQQTYLGKNQETHYLLPFVFHLFIFIFGLSKKPNFDPIVKWKQI